MAQSSAPREEPSMEDIEKLNENLKTLKEKILQKEKTCKPNFLKF